MHLVVVNLSWNYNIYICTICSFLVSGRYLCVLKWGKYRLKRLFFYPNCLLSALIFCHWHFPPIFCVSEFFLLFFSMSVTTPSSQSIFISCFLTAALPKGNVSGCVHGRLTLVLVLVSCRVLFSHLWWTSLPLAIKSCFLLFVVFAMVPLPSPAADSPAPLSLGVC